jgi:hypothetical protein
MTAIIPPGITPTGERVERFIEGVGLVVFENYGPGTWMTKKGEPAKISRRRYLLDGEEQDAVSSITDTLDKPALQRWIEDQATRGAVVAERLGELVDVPEEDWAGRVKSLGIGATAKKEEGGDRGTVIHTAMDDLTRGIIPNPADFPEIGRPWVRGAMRAWLKLDPKVIASEEIVCNPELGYAGRPDLVATVDGKVTLIDWKSGKGRVFDQSHYQTRLYAMALHFCGIDVERILVVGIGNDGGHELIDCAVTEEEAKALITVYRSRKRANSSMATQRKIANKGAA